MYLREFSLGNFKAFGPTQTLPIKPITLIFGPNSGGKSSLIHGLLLARHAVVNNTADIDVQRVDIDGEHVDLGGFCQYVFVQDLAKSVLMGFALDASPWFPGGGVKRVGMCSTLGASEAWHVDKRLRGTRGRRLPPTQMTHEVRLDDLSVMKLATSDDGSRMTVSYVEPNLLTALIGGGAARASSRQSPGDSHLQAAVAHFVEGFIYANPEFLPRTLDKRYPYYPEKAAKDADRFLDAPKESRKMRLDGELERQWRELVSTSLTTHRAMQTTASTEAPPREALDSDWLRATLKARHGLLAPAKSGPPAGLHLVEDAFTEWSGYVDSFSEAIRRDLRSLHYHGPLRAYPPRHIMASTIHDVGSLGGGVDAWEQVRRHEGLREQVNGWLGSGFLTTPYRFEVRKLYDLEDVWRKHEKPFSAQTTQRLMDRLTSGVEPRERELVLVDGRTGAEVSHRDIGVGVSQILPVLVAAFGSNGQTIAVEQPEVHLHPALQAEMGDLFIKSALERQNTLLLETHSEHLILRILRRIRETTEGELPDGKVPIKPEHVSVVYVEPTQAGAVVHPLTVTPDGDFADKWPGGFFAERAAELF